MDELESAIRLKELELIQDNKAKSSKSNNKALNIRKKSDKRESSKNRGNSRSKSSKKVNKSKLRCHYSKNLGRFRKECPERLKKQGDNQSE